MKLALIRQRYNPFGGAERFVERALSALRQEGAEITLITRSWAGAEQDGFNVQICDPGYSRLWGGRAARDRSFSRAVRAYLAQASFDMVQAHERIPGCTIFRAGDGVHAAWLEHRARVLGPWARWAQRWSPFHRQVLASERAMLAHPGLRAVICNSRLVAAEFARYYAVPADQLHVIYNGVDGEMFHPGLAETYRSSVRADHGIPEDAPVLLFVGSGFERKGIPALLEAMKHMARKDAWLVVVGADRRLKAMQRKAEQLGIAARVRFTGPLKDVRPWYGAADGFVLPTLYDPCPNAALEALSSGLPCLVSDRCGAAELIQSGVNGLVCDALDVAGLAEHMDMLAGWSGSAQVRSAARQAVAHLSLPAMAAELLALYHQLAGQLVSKAQPV